VYRETPRGQGDDYNEIWVRPKDHEGDSDYEIKVRQYKDTDEIVDSYFNILFRESAVKELESMTNEIFGQCVVYSSLGNDALVPSDITKDSSALEFLQADTFFCDIATTYDVSRKEDVAQQFITELEEKGIILNIRILFVTEQAFESIQNNPDEKMIDYFLEAWDGNYTNTLAVGDFIYGYDLEGNRETTATWEWNRENAL
jgi:hypothetical protein